jgi:exodeoxyribonuclease V gamma subunit
MTTAGVHVHRAERADVLADALAEVLARPLADPFAAEVVAVPAKGVERWLAQRLSHRLGAPDGDGICAGVAFRSPAALVTESISGAIGGAPDADPWHPERALWPLLEVLDAAAEEPWCAVLHAHHDRRHALARRLAELFGAYATHRPEMLRAWRAGECGVDADLAWQPELWRRLRARVGGPDPTERVDAACAALRADPAVVALPERLSLFGPTRLAAQELAVLAALGEHRAVHLWLPHPSPRSGPRLLRTRQRARCRRAPLTERRRGRAPPAVLARARCARAAGAAHRGRARPRRRAPPLPRAAAHAAGQAAAGAARRPAARHDRR